MCSGRRESSSTKTARKTCGKQLASEDPGQIGTVAMDSGLNLQNLDKNLEVRVLSKTREAMEVEVRGIDAPIANALRRIMIDEVGSPGPHRRH